jgi:hypothetical protein
MIIKDILVGEDIRQEVGSKISLMGLFGGDINIEIPANAPKDIPAGIMLAILITIENTNRIKMSKDYSVMVSVSLENNSVVNIKAQIESESNDRRILLPIPKIKIPIFVSGRNALLIKAQIFKAESIIAEESTTIDINLNRHS